MKTTVIDTQGVEAESFAKTLKSADLNWTPKADGVGGVDTGIVMPRKKLLYRSDNQAPLGIVGEEYSPSSPKEFLESQYEFAEFIKGRVSRAGFIPSRSRAFAFVRMDQELSVPRVLRKKGDPLRAYIYSTDGWDGGTPRRSRLYLERLICSNGMTSREIKADLWVSHTKGREEAYGNRWKTFMQKTAETITTVMAQFKELAETRMSPEEAKSFFEKLLPGKSTRTQGTRSQLFRLFGAEGVGNEGVSRWDAYNAVTEYVTHHRTYRGNEATPVTTNRFLGVLETDTMSPRALNFLLN